MSGVTSTGLQTNCLIIIIIIIPSSCHSDPPVTGLPVTHMLSQAIWPTDSKLLTASIIESVTPGAQPAGLNLLAGVAPDQEGSLPDGRQH
jgi:hypothetical protein